MRFSDYPLKTKDKIRYADTDRQGHVNNAVFSSFLETGRVEVLYDEDDPLLREDASFVIVSLKLDFLKELNWPGEVFIGTGIKKIGKSSITISQQLFQNDNSVASAETVIVQVDGKGQSTPLTEEAVEKLSRHILS